MGKILIEKLLVSCPNIGNLYLLIREKKGKTPEERFDVLFKDDVSCMQSKLNDEVFFFLPENSFQIFSRLHKLHPDFRSKLIAVNGDVTQSKLGMSDSDYDTITKEVSVIFHGAANVRFDETLKSAVNINVKGVLEMLELARRCSSLKVSVLIKMFSSVDHIC